MKLFVLVLLFVTLASYIQARSISVVGDIRVIKDDDKWVCDMIECPQGTDRCVVSKSNRENPSVMKRVNFCYSENNEILLQKETSSATDPNINVSQTVEMFSNGSTSVSGNSNGILISSNGGESTNFNAEEFNNNMQHEMNKLQSNLQQMQNNIQRGIEEQQRRLQESLSQMPWSNGWSNMFG